MGAAFILVATCEVVLQFFNWIAGEPPIERAIREFMRDMKGGAE